MEEWNVGMMGKGMEEWKNGQNRNNGILEWWKDGEGHGRMECWNVGIMEEWKGGWVEGRGSHTEAQKYGERFKRFPVQGLTHHSIIPSFQYSGFQPIIPVFHSSSIPRS